MSATLKIKINDAERVTATLYSAAKRDRAEITIILGHGAGADQLSGFMRMFATGLAARGLDVLTFNFLYTEQKRRLPDSKERLESCYRAVIEGALNHRSLKKNRLVIGLVFLGYPLHPPGRPDKLRVEHLKNIRAPMLFVQGSRDAFGTGEEVRAIIKKLHLPATLYAIEGGDHSLKVPKSLGVPQPEVYEKAIDETAEWLRTI